MQVYVIIIASLEVWNTCFNLQLRQTEFHSHALQHDSQGKEMQIQRRISTLKRR